VIPTQTTERLYYLDSTLREFAGRVVARQELAGRPAVALDRSAFYPTGGGQPHDTGALRPRGAPEGVVHVVDVIADDGLVWHVLDAPLPADDVVGALDWARRLDHMQQHTGQHVLSQAFVQTRDAETVAFHLGVNTSTIDLNRVDLGPDDLAATEAAAEAVANAVIDEARPVTATFYDEAALDQVPLRKPPKVSGQIRVVQVAGYDWSACGGTHVSNTAQIGLIKIIGTERRGPETRVTFLCGGRARADYARLTTLADGLVARFTTSQDELLAAVDRLLAEGKAVRRELGELEAAWVASTADALWAAARPAGDRRVIAVAVDYSVERAKRVAQALRGRPGAVVVVGVRGERPQLICTRADDVTLDAGDLLRTAVTVGGGRGGGRPDWAQGGVPTDAALDVALAAAARSLDAT